MVLTAVVRVAILVVVGSLYSSAFLVGMALVLDSGGGGVVVVVVVTKHWWWLWCSGCGGASDSLCKGGSRITCKSSTVQCRMCGKVLVKVVVMVVMVLVVVLVVFV